MRRDLSLGLRGCRAQFSLIYLELQLNLHILICLVQLQLQLDMNNMHHQVSLQLHLFPTQPLGLTTISSPCEPHHGSTSIFRLPLLRKRIQQVWHLWNTTSTSVLDRWYWIVLVLFRGSSGGCEDRWYWTVLVLWFLWRFFRWVWIARIIVYWASFYIVVDRCPVTWCEMCIHSISRV